MDEPQAVKMIACPEGCGVELPASDLAAQSLHMDLTHPDVVLKQMRETGIVSDLDRGPAPGTFWIYVDRRAPLTKNGRTATIIEIVGCSHVDHVVDFIPYSSFMVGYTPIPDVLRPGAMTFEHFWQLVATSFLTLLDPKPRTFRTAT